MNRSLSSLYLLLLCFHTSLAQRARYRRSLFRKEATEINDETRALLDLLDATSTNSSSSAAAGDAARSSHRDLAAMPTEILDAIVIGAGWAGLGAAKVLSNNNLKFVVLESRDYVGGRSHSSTLDSFIIELGSQWIQGTTTSNPVVKLVQTYSAPTKTSGIFNDGVWSNEYQSTTPHRVSDTEVTRIFRALYRDGWFPFQQNRQDNTNVDSSLRVTTDLYIKNKNLNANEKRALEMELDSMIVQEYAASLEDMSTWWWNEDEFIGGGDAILTDGYSNLVNSYASTMLDRIYLSTKVTKADWTNSVVTVTYSSGGVTSTVRARNVIVTAPLGVLKANKITFQPAMPTWKSTSIARLGVGLLDKLIMKWDASTTLPWPSNAEWLEKIATPQGQWTEFFSYQPTTGQKILVAFSAGREASRVETLSDATIVAEALASLKEVFGKTIPTPKAYVVTRWSKDANALGSYSYYKVGSKPNDRKNLAATLGGRVYFAGEACHLLYPSTTHGALLTGLDVGNKVVLASRRRISADGEDDDMQSDASMSFKPALALMLVLVATCFF